MTEREAIAYLSDRGYKVSKVRAPRLSARTRRHRDCVEHVRVAGYTDPVCVLHRQDRVQVVGFAVEVAAIGRRAHARHVAALAA